MNVPFQNLKCTLNENKNLTDNIQQSFHMQNLNSQQYSFSLFTRNRMHAFFSQRQRHRVIWARFLSDLNLLEKSIDR